MVQNNQTNENNNVTGASIKAKAESAIEKGRRESLEAKLKPLVSKVTEAERTICQTKLEIETLITAFDQGL